MSIERRGDARILARTPATVSVEFHQAGAIADPGEVTATITRADGSVLVPVAPVEGETAAARTLELSASETADVDLLLIDWESDDLGTVRTRVEIVGDQLFTVREARAFDGGKLSDPTKFQTAAIEATRARIEDAFAEICGVSFIPRLRIAVLGGQRSCTLVLPDLKVTELRSVETRSGTDWTAFTSDELEAVLLDPAGVLVRDSYQVWPWGNRNVRVSYVHGFETVPMDVRRAGLILARYELVESNLSDRATSFSDESGTYRIATAGLTRGSWFGLPLVDSVLQRPGYMHRTPGIA